MTTQNSSAATSTAVSDANSNTTNAEKISGDALTKLIVGRLDSDGGRDPWKDRAIPLISLISNIMPALIYMRDQGEILLGVDTIREHLMLDNILKLHENKRAVPFPAHIVEGIKAYLVSLPGFKLNAEKQSDHVYEHHGYLQMQFTHILRYMADEAFYPKLGKPDCSQPTLPRAAVGGRPSM